MSLIDPSILNGLGFLFNKTCTVLEESRTQDSTGQPIETWETLAYTLQTDEGHEIVTHNGEPIKLSLLHKDLPCVLSPARQQGRNAEIRKRDRTYVVASYKVLMQGFYPAITELMRVVVGLETYDILLVQHDSQNLLTTLFVEVIK